MDVNFDEILMKINDLNYMIISLKNKTDRQTDLDKMALEALLNKCFERICATTQDERDKIFNNNLIKRFVAIVNANVASHEIMRPVYARDTYFLKSVPMPEGSLSISQNDEINAFWQQYSFAYKNNPDTQRYFSLMSGVFNPTYIGFGLQCHFLKKFWENSRTPFINDKNNLDLLFPNVKIPEIVFRRKRGIYFSAQYEQITKEDAWGGCLDALYGIRKWDLILKPTTGYGGAGLYFMRNNMSEPDNKAIFDNIGTETDFICQRVVSNHATWKTTKGSRGFNVARINTINYKGKLEIVSAYLKMAPDTNLEIVNIGTGAFGIRIFDDGTLDKRAVDFYKSKWCYLLPNGDRFADRKLYNYDKVKETVLNCASKIPECPMIAWDVAVDDNGDVTIIELNPSGGTEEVQVHGLHPYRDIETFKEILDRYLVKSFYYPRANWDWDYWEFRNTVSLHKYEGFNDTVVVPEMVDGKKVTIVHDFAFSGKRLKKIVIPNKRIAVSEKVFDNCGTCEIEIY